MNRLWRNSWCNRMKKPGICAVIVNNNLEPVKEIEPLVDLFEVRIDLIGDHWPEIAKHLTKPWIACNRIAGEGGRWPGNEAGRIEKLLQAIELGAAIVEMVRKRAECLLSFHDMQKTPSFYEMKGIIENQLEAGADICKVVTTAQTFEDNATVLRLIPESPGARLISLAMGPLGSLSRVLCPLIGGQFTYASIDKGGESAPGQVTVRELVTIYKMMGQY